MTTTLRIKKPRPYKPLPDPQWLKAARNELASAKSELIDSVKVEHLLPVERLLKPDWQPHYMRLMRETPYQVSAKINRLIAARDALLVAEAKRQKQNAARLLAWERRMEEYEHQSPILPGDES